LGTTSRATERNGSFEARLPPQPSSVAEARRHVRDFLEGAGRSDLLEPALLLVSEIVTNALLHAGTEVDLAGHLEGDTVRLEVGDGSTHLPSRRDYAPTSGTGRGLLMLESMVDDWGVTRRERGKVVWFRISPESADWATESSSSQRGDMPVGIKHVDGDSVPVALDNVPLLLHAAWQEHAEALLREYLLASLDSRIADPIKMHAEATDAIAVLEEHIPRPSVPMDPDQLMSDATEPHVSAPHIEVPVPLESVAHFDTLDRAIEAALDLSREGLVLTPPTQPEVQSFRRWLCRQVLRQAAGNRPEPWAVPDALATDPPADMSGWNPAWLADADRAVIAANDASQIIGISPPAARLLGYDDGSELLGERLISIIPERYRQAHVAGFTMFLLVGRRPLLDNEVVVPALRRDGTEVSIALLVREQTIEGRSVLVGEMSPAPASA
jgi:PAS domain S-box-containing protein